MRTLLSLLGLLGMALGLAFRGVLTTTPPQASRVKAPFLLGIPTNTETLSGDKTLTRTDSPVQFLDPDGARNVDLPAEEDGLFFIIVNRADMAEDITVREDSGMTTIITVSQNEVGIVVCDGTNWDGFVGANT